MLNRIITKKFSNSSQGSAMIEIIIGSSIMLVGILAIVASYNTYIQYALTNQSNVESTYLLREGLEVVSYMRDKGWAGNIANLSTSNTYYLTWSANDWSITTTPVYVDGIYLRSITISDVMRDVNDDISVSGTNDPDTKLITASVSFMQSQGMTTKTMSKYITNIK